MSINKIIFILLFTSIILSIGIYIYANNISNTLPYKTDTNQNYNKLYEWQKLENNKDNIEGQDYTYKEKTSEKKQNDIQQTLEDNLNSNNIVKINTENTEKENNETQEQKTTNTQNIIYENNTPETKQQQTTNNKEEKETVDEEYKKDIANIETQNIKDYGNKIALIITNTLIPAEKRTEKFNEFMKKQNKQTANSILNIADTYISVSTQLEKITPPKEFKDTHNKLTMSYGDVGIVTKELSKLNKNDEIIDYIMHQYEHSVGLFTKNFVEIVELFKKHNIKFKQNEPGNIFTPISM